MPKGPSLISLRRTPREKRDMASSFGPEEYEDFGHGLTLHLGPEEIKKLGLGKEGIDAGKTVGIVATGMVKSNNVELVNNMSKRSMAIQIQSMQVAAMGEDADGPKNEAELIYGGKVAKS